MNHARRSAASVFFQRPARAVHHSTGIVAVSSTAANAVSHHQAGASERSSIATACHWANSFTAPFELECEGGIHFAELPRATGRSSQDATAQLRTSEFVCPEELADPV